MSKTGIKEDQDLSIIMTIVIIVVRVNTDEGNINLYLPKY
jgi:hypothetical protein